MKRSLARKSIVLGAGGMLVAGLMSTAYGATAANAASIANVASVTQAQAHGPSWHTILSVPNGTKSNLVDTVIATGKTSSYLTDIIALAPNNVYATGEDANPLAGPAVLLHFNGRTWSRVAASSGFISIPGRPLASDGKGGLWIAAQNPGVASEEGSDARLIHYSAGKLTAVALPGGAASGTVSRIPGTAAALAGGVQYGTGHGTSVVFQYS